MKVKEIIEALSKFDPDREVYDYGFDKIERIYETHWVDNNYPWEDEEDRIIIE